MTGPVAAHRRLDAGNDQPYWALIKGPRRVECHSRRVALGPELRVVIDGTLWWSHVFVSPTLLEEAIDRQRRRFEAAGWHPPSRVE
jgi:hypothetical protein